MTMKMYAVRDVKAEAFAKPMAVPTEGLAVRSFTDACLQPGSVIAKDHADYMLYELGSYDPNSGRIESLPVPKLIVAASTIVLAARDEARKTQPEIPAVAEVA